MKQIETHVFELSLKDLFNLPIDWQVLVYNLKTKRYAMGVAGDCSTQASSTQVYFALDLPSYMVKTIQHV
ncbi:MAG: hypothetical protein LUD19_06350 [Clostridia bacterium]|nr:hypothetical protein [Clostridia bacterium]